MKTTLLIKSIYRQKLHTVNQVEAALLFNLLDKMKKQNQQRIRYKFQRSFFGNKKAEIALYKYIYKIYKQTIQENMEIYIIKLVIKKDPYNVYWYRIQLPSNIRAVIYNQFFWSYDNKHSFIIRKAFKLLKQDNFNQIWELKLNCDYLSDIMFFSMLLHKFLNKQKRRLMMININYYVFTERTYHPREFKIAWTTLNTNVSNHKFINKFYNNWRTLKLDDFYSNHRGGYFLITLKFRVNANNIKLGYLSLPRVQLKETLKDTTNFTPIKYDFNIIS